MDIDTLLIHGNLEETRGEHLRSLKTPIYETASYDFENAESMEAAFSGRELHYAYSRTANPTVSALQARIKTLTQAENVLCVSSGMAAITTVLLTLCQTGDNIIASKYLFGNTYSLLKDTLQTLGITTRFVDLEAVDKLDQYIDDRTRLVFGEVLTNPQLILFDFEALGRFCKEKKLFFMVDNTALTPLLFEAKKYPIDIEICSNTKFFSGGATSIGGSIILYPSDKYLKNPKLASAISLYGEAVFFKKMFREIFRNTGACLAPHNAYLQLLGLETLRLRLDKICENALAIAQFLKAQKAVQYVAYAGLSDYTYRDSALYYLGGKGASLIEFRLASRRACFEFLNALKVIRRGTNFCDNKSMIIHPASTIFVEFPASECIDLQVYDNALRLSVGIETIRDLKEDITQALQQVINI